MHFRHHFGDTPLRYLSIRVDTTSGAIPRVFIWRSDHRNGVIFIKNLKRIFLANNNNTSTHGMPLRIFSHNGGLLIPRWHMSQRIDAPVFSVFFFCTFFLLAIRSLWAHLSSPLLTYSVRYSVVCWTSAFPHPNATKPPYLIGRCPNRLKWHTPLLLIPTSSPLPNLFTENY